MTRQSKTQINVSRLIVQCEAMASKAQQKGGKVDWRLSKYLKYLEDQLDCLVTDKKGKPDDTIREFKHKVDFLKDIVKADKVENPLEKTLICQHLLPETVVSSSSASSEEEFQNLKTKELHLQVKGKHHNDLRQQLFGENDQLRKRRGAKEEDSTADNIDEIIKHHEAMQEKVAEEMIRMAQAMKHNSLIARDIIKKDNSELERSTKVVDHNVKKMQTESERLEELNKRKCSWTIWIMLVIVCIVFINMIIFVKFFKKRKL